MKAKAALFAILLAILIVENGEARWRWGEKVWRGAKKAWHKHSWIRKVAGIGVKLLMGDVKKMREMDDESYEEIMAKLEEDIAGDFDDNQAKDFLNGLDEIRNLSDDEFKKLEDLSSEYASVKQNDVAESEALKALARHLQDHD